MKPGKTGFSSHSGYTVIRTNQSVEVEKIQINLAQIEFLRQEGKVETTEFSRVAVANIDFDTFTVVSKNIFGTDIIFNIKNISDRTVKISRPGQISSIFLFPGESVRIDRSEVDEAEIVTLESDGRISVRVAIR